MTTDDERSRGASDVPRPRPIGKYYHDLEGYNGRLDAIQAGSCGSSCGISTAGTASAALRRVVITSC